MSDYRRVRVPGGTYFFTLVTQGRRPWFREPANVEVLRQAFREVRSRRPFTLQAAVVLPDHLHCLWELPDEDSDYPGRWREIKKYVSRRLSVYRNAHNEAGVWQRRYWEHLIRDEADWRRHLDYIHYNPVKHGLAVSPVDWPWSSFRIAVRRGWYDLSWGVERPAVADEAWD